MITFIVFILPSKRTSTNDQTVSNGNTTASLFWFMKSIFFWKISIFGQIYISKDILFDKVKNKNKAFMNFQKKTRENTR